MSSTGTPPEEKQVKKRQCGPKVRSGCKTCKIRRVKCDETHPSCKRCTSTGRKCDGYGFSTVTFENQTLSVLQRKFNNLQGTSDEKRGFSFFLQNTAPELSGYFATEFWGQLIIQASIAEPSLRHALIALGSLHEEFTNKKLTYSPHDHGFAMAQHTQAIGHLRKSLAGGKHAPLPALMSCLLFVCFDSIRGAFSSAMLHLKSGMKIIRDIRTKATNCSQEEEYMIENTIAPMFVRLSLQTILYMDTRSTENRVAFSSYMLMLRKEATLIPESFESLDATRLALEMNVEEVFRFILMCDGQKRWADQPPQAMELRETCARNNSLWNTAFENFMNEHSAKLDSKQLRGAALLKIQHTGIKIMADSAPSLLGDDRSQQEVHNDPAAYSKLENDFETIVKLSKSLISAAELDAKNGKPSLSFSTDMGIIAPLYYTCTHSTSKSTRAKALDLLSRCPRREGMWDSQRSAQIVREFWVCEDRHKMLEQEAGEVLPLSELLDLEMYDGMHWEWRWKDPGSTGLSTGSTPPVLWGGEVEDQIWFEGRKWPVFEELGDEAGG